MKAFVVSLNGKKLYTAGIGKHGVLSAHVIWPKGGDIQLRVGGLDSRSDESLAWPLRELQVGDSVTVDVIETDNVDVPEERRPRRVGDERPDGPLRRAAWFVWDLFDKDR